ncbi:hypothetical protein [Maricaulis sp.]|jgi:type II secretory pathway pseudopilin PulG|uniref:hypothetical protein n=1 Tax=Maricaulis sp. TaxID=1486257 RepID=UPI0026121C58|nr:hypothetical protein [Maricaulis sp.]MDF1768506.1 hypothetical protein [Maricaulis sp.]
MTATIILVVLAMVLLVVLGARGRKQRDNAAEAARRAVEARLEPRDEDAASHKDEDSRA